MATTPEGKVKLKVKVLLHEYKGLYSYWPVPSGYGKTTLDIVGCYRGRFFAIETKAEGKKPTLRQMEEIAEIQVAMGKVFIIAGENSPTFSSLKAWLDNLTETEKDDPYQSPDQVHRRPV